MNLIRDGPNQLTLAFRANCEHFCDHQKNRCTLTGLCDTLYGYRIFENWLQV